jgi:dTMP kinase
MDTKTARSSRILPSFVAIEGIDGAGTTTQLHRIAAACVELGRPHWITCEPTTMPIGKLIREVLGGGLDVRPETLARLYAADRYEHIYGEGDGILAHLDRGDLVVTDRYLFSSLAYQSIDCGFDTVSALNDEFPLPEIVLYVDVPPEIGDSRTSTREVREIFENTEFQTKVRDMYDRAFRDFAGSEMKIVWIDGTASPDQVFEKLWSHIDGIPIQKV